MSGRRREQTVPFLVFVGFGSHFGCIFEEHLQKMFVLSVYILWEEIGSDALVEQEQSIHHPFDTLAVVFEVLDELLQKVSDLSIDLFVVLLQIVFFQLQCLLFVQFRIVNSLDLIILLRSFLVVLSNDLLGLIESPPALQREPKIQFLI